MSQIERMQWLRGTLRACKGIVGGSKDLNVLSACISAQAQAVIRKAISKQHSPFCLHEQAEGISEASGEPERTNASAQQYAAACKEAGKATDTPVLDMFSKVPDDSHDWKERFLIDGLHFTPAGQQRVYLLLVEAMAQHFPELGSASYHPPCPGLGGAVKQGGSLGEFPELGSASYHSPCPGLRGAVKGAPLGNSMQMHMACHCG